MSVWSRKEDRSLPQTILFSDRIEAQLELGRSTSNSIKSYVMMEIILRTGLLLVFLIGEFSYATNPIIQKEDLWRHRFPLKESQVPFTSLLMWIAVTSFCTIYWFGFNSKATRKSERLYAVLGISLSILLTMTITDVIKVTVGRPRPNYLVRCYGNPEYLTVEDGSKPCIPSDDKWGDLHKSFPSGHTSVSFAGFGFISLYIAGKLGTFNSRGRGSGWRLCLTMLPVVVASWVGVTRYADYHHHVEDVLAGLILGSIVAYFSYRCYYSSVSSEYAAYPTAWISTKNTSGRRRENSVNGDILLHLEGENGTGSMNDGAKGDSYMEDGEKVRAISYITGDINMSVRLSRHHPDRVGAGDGIPKNNPWASVQLIWDSKNGSFTSEDLQAIKEQLPNALSNVQRSLEEKENGNTMKRI